jgi:5-methylcytosine-specific restriction endonuclease McrA
MLLTKATVGVEGLTSFSKNAESCLFLGDEMLHRLEYHQEYRKNHPEYVERQKAITRKWMAEHKDYMKNHNKKWRLENKERNKNNHNKWDAMHRKQNNERAKKYREAHKEQRMEYQKKYREIHKNYLQQYDKKRDKTPRRTIQRSFSEARRRARENNAEGLHTVGEWELLKKQYGYVCSSCNRKEPDIKLTEDHIIPLSKGGSDYIENIQPLCKSCNCKKHTKIIKFQLKKGSR